MRKNLIDVAKHQNKLQKIVALNIAGATIFTDKTAMALYSNVSKSEFIEAFKADIDKTATYLIDSLGIINSIKNGLIQEITTLDNSVESFFGTTYNNGVITLCGVEFIPGATTFTKAKVIDYIYKQLFEIDKKTLNSLAKNLQRYETSNSDIEKALLYPSTVIADKLIEKIGLINHKFEEFRENLSYEELAEFSTYFNRSTITDVIQNSTFIDLKGIRQIASSHKNRLVLLQKLSNNIKQGVYKYVQALELDSDADVNKALRIIEQIERLKLNIKEKFTLKFRKLGNYNARGLCIDSLGIIAEDVRNSSALLHEIAHYIHLSNKQIFESKFVNYMISKLTQKIDLANVPEEFKLNISKKGYYYTSEKEVIARALEIAALFANESSKVIYSDDEFDLIKSREHYEEYEGLYFNFNSFDSNTKDEMLKLYTMFFETSYDNVATTNLDLFVKIDTNFSKKQKDIKLLINEANRISKKEQKELYSYVSMENIDLIINNKPKTLGIENFALILFQNISLWSAMNQRMGIDDWANVIESQYTPIFIKLINTVKETLNSYEYVSWLNEFKNDIAFKAVDNLIGLNGFGLNFRVELRSKLSNLPNYLEFKSFRDPLVKYGPLALANKEVLEDLDYIKNFCFNNRRDALRIRNLELFNEDVYMSIYKYLYENGKRDSIPQDLVEKIASSNEEIVNPTIEDKKSEIELIVEGIEKEHKDKLEELKINQVKKPLFDKTLGDKIEEIRALQKQEFEKMIQEAQVVDFEHTKTGKQLKVLKVKEKIANFKAFNEYLINNGIAYYSKFAQGFIIKNYERVQIASATALAIYSQDLLDTFAKGTLF